MIDLISVVFKYLRRFTYQDLFVPPSGKRKRDDSSAQYQNGGYIPQQDGARDAMPKVRV